ncbi:MAG: 2-dehydropantoate 2-reductase [Geminicoccaceae bacterium]
MKVAIVGVGAMGSIYAGLMADAGNEVHVVDIWREHLDAIREKGLRVEGASGDRTVKGIITTGDMADIAGCELVVIATKASGVSPAAKALAPHLRDGTIVLTIQNGLGAGERIAAHLPKKHIMLGVAQGFGASIRAPGHAHHNGMALIRIGELEGGNSERLDRVEKLWRDAGFDVRQFADINRLIWEKFVCNVAFSAPCTVFGRTIGELMADPKSWKIAQACAREAYELGRAKGVNFSFDDPESYVGAFGGNMPNARPSMLLDHDAKRVSEIDAINGMVATLGTELGIPTPYNETLSAIVEAREKAFAAS